jgi:hypothetical protein
MFCGFTWNVVSGVNEIWIKWSESIISCFSIKKSYWHKMSLKSLPTDFQISCLLCSEDKFTTNKKCSFYYKLYFNLSLCKTWNQSLFIACVAPNINNMVDFKIIARFFNPSQRRGLEKSFNLLHIRNTKRAMRVEEVRATNFLTKWQNEGMFSLEFFLYSVLGRVNFEGMRVV